MVAVEFIGGLIVGFVLGIGAAIFYLRWKMQKQISSIEDQMGAMMEMSEEMSGMMAPEEEDLELDQDEEREEKES